jgi:hypothetical protein
MKKTLNFFRDFFKNILGLFNEYFLESSDKSNKKTIQK